MAQHLVDSMRERIDTSSQHIAKFLHESGEFAVDELQHNLGIEEHVFNWAIGWLIQQDAVAITEANGSFKIHRKEPDISKPILI